MGGVGRGLFCFQYLVTSHCNVDNTLKNLFMLGQRHLKDVDIVEAHCYVVTTGGLILMSIFVAESINQ